jgi:hypothetical protein
MHCAGGDEYGGHWQHDIDGIIIESTRDVALMASFGLSLALYLNPTYELSRKSKSWHPSF